VTKRERQAYEYAAEVAAERPSREPLCGMLRCDSDPRAKTLQGLVRLLFVERIIREAKRCEPQ
jgi:hypothetical protein